MGNSAIRVGGQSLVGQISGLVVTNNTTDPDHDIDISTGVAVSNDGTAQLVLQSGLIKQIDANWAEGSNQGGFPSNLTLTVDTWYKVLGIRRTVDGNIDVGFDVSASAANLLLDATDYGKPRYCGSVLTDGSLNIIAFLSVEQAGGGIFVQWLAPPINTITTDMTTATNRDVQTPNDRKTLAYLNVRAFNTVDDSVHHIFDPDLPDATPSITVSPLGSISGNVGSSPDQTALMATMQVMTNSNSQIKNVDTAAATDVSIVTTGYMDSRVP